MRKASVTVTTAVQISRICMVIGLTKIARAAAHIGGDARVVSSCCR